MGLAGLGSLGSQPTSGVIERGPGCGGSLLQAQHFLWGQQTETLSPSPAFSPILSLVRRDGGHRNNDRVSPGLSGAALVSPLPSHCPDTPQNLPNTAGGVATQGLVSLFGFVKLPAKSIH